MIWLYWFLLSCSAFAREFVFSEQDFHDVIDRLEALYSKQARGSIEVVRFWDISGEKDSAIRVPFLTMERPLIKLTGLVPKSGLISKDGFALLVCHEFGHHLAKGPQLGTRKLVSWSSAEGQADYWATSVCLKKYMGSDDNILLMKNTQVPEDLRKKCETSFSSLEETALCTREEIAALSIASYFTSLGSKIDVQTHAPAASSLVRTFRQDAFRDQCRLETFLAGSLCVQRETGEECVKGDGARPSCWFVSETPNIPTLQE